MKNLEENKLIAEFMGGKFQPELIAPWKFENPPTPYLREDARIKDLKYDSDWNWLMPVVEKIGKCTFDERAIELVKTIHKYVCLVQILDAHMYVIEYIKWYNSQDK